jgi:protein SHQ1
MDLAKSALGDVHAIMLGGKRAILRCLLRIHRILERSEQYYLHNRLFVSDICAWFQQANLTATLPVLSGQFEKAIHHIQLDNMRWPLKLLEEEVLLANEDEEGDETDGGDSDDDSSSESGESSSDESSSDEEQSGSEVDTVEQEEEKEEAKQSDEAVDGTST